MNGNKWQLIRDVLLSGTFIFCLGILWQAASFCQSMKDYVADHGQKHIQIDCKIKTIENDVQILKEWKIAKTQKPFVENEKE